MLGCLLAGFYLLRVHDMPRWPRYVAVALNVLVAGIALVAREGDAAHRRPWRRADGRSSAAPGAWAVYVAIGLSGMTALGAEVIWTRLLSLLFGATVYTFSLILAVFLLGLGIGSSLGSALAGRIARPAPRARLVPDAHLRRDRVERRTC